MKKLITIVGVGALGSHVALLLRNVEADLKIIDFDRVEQKNTASQFFGKPNVGKSKVDSLKQNLFFFFEKPVLALPRELQENNVSELLTCVPENSVIIDCLDNGKARRLVQTFIRDRKIPCVHGALAANGEMGQVTWDEDFQIDDEPGAGAATCEGGEHLPFIVRTAAYLATSVQEFLKTGKKQNFLIYKTGANLT